MNMQIVKFQEIKKNKMRVEEEAVDGEEDMSKI